MNHGSIISEGEALQILKNDLRRAALEKHASDLNEATFEKRAEIMAQIEADIDREIRQRAKRIDPGALLH